MSASEVAAGAGIAGDRASVLLHTLVFPPDEVSTASLIGRLARELVSKGHRVTVITSTPHYNFDAERRASQPLRPGRGGVWMESEYHGVRVLHVSGFSHRRTGWWRIVDYLRYHVVASLLTLEVRHDFDVVLAATPPPSVGAVALLMAKLLRVPMVYNIQELFPDVLVAAGMHRPLIGRLVGRIEGLIYRRSDALVPITSAFGRRLVERGADPANVRVIPNFAELDRIRPMTKSESGFAEIHGLLGVFVVLYAGNLGTTQDLESVLDAARRLPDVRFVLVGAGVRRDWLVREVERRDLPNVLVLPFQPRSAVSEVYGASDLCVVPLKAQGAKGTFPSKIYTIMAARRPVVALAELGSALSRLVREVGCGWTVAPGDPTDLARAIRAAREKPSERARRADAGRAYVEEHHAPDTVAEAYSRLLDEVTGKEGDEGRGRADAWRGR